MSELSVERPFICMGCVSVLTFADRKGIAHCERLVTFVTQRWSVRQRGEAGDTNTGV